MWIERAALLAIAVLGVSACGYPIFTDAVARRYSLTTSDIRRIQFYTSGEIVLQRELADQEKGVSGNELTIKDGVRIEEVIIPSKTPGVALRVEGEYMLVSFSRQYPERALWFAVRHTDQTEGLADAKKFELVQLTNPLVEPPPFHPVYSKGFLVTYNGRKYHVTDGKMWNVHLLYDLDETVAKEKVRESPPGWRLNEGAPSAKPMPAPAPVPTPTPAAPTNGGTQP